MRSWTAPFEGVMGYFDRKLEQTDSETQKDRLLGYTREVPCPTCKGARLKPEILAVRLDSGSHGALSIAGLTALSVHEAFEFLDNLTLGKREEMIAGAVLKEIHARLKFLLDVGLSYLTLDRAAGTCLVVKRSVSAWLLKLVPVWLVCSTSWMSHPLVCTNVTTSA